MTWRHAGLALLAIQAAHWAFAIFCCVWGNISDEMPGLSVAIVASLAIGTCVSAGGGASVDGPCDAVACLVTALLFFVPFFAAPAVLSQVVWWVAMQFHG